MAEALITTWEIKDQNHWLPVPENKLSPELKPAMNVYLENKRYLSVGLGLMLFEQNKNCALFFNTRTGNFVGIGVFHESDVQKLV